MGEGGGRRMKMVVNAKMTPVKTVPEMRVGGMKESSRGGEFKYDTFDTL
jgi:hypothetical protein